MKKNLFSIILLWINTAVFSQNYDSLLSVFNNQTLSDTIRLQAINKVAWDYSFIKPDTAILLAKQGLYLVQTGKFKKHEAELYNFIASSYDTKGDYANALKNYLIALKIYKETSNKKGIAYCHSNIGIIYRKQGNYPKALEQYFLSLRIKEEVGDKKGISNCYITIGNVYYLQGNYSKALKNHLSALKIKKEIGDKKGIAMCYNNIGLVYENQNNYTEALKNYYASIKIREELGDKGGVALSYRNIGLVYENQKNLSEALKMYSFSLKIADEIGDKEIVAGCYNSIGGIYFQQGKITESKQWQQRGLKLAKEIGIKEDIKVGYMGLATIDSALGNYREAYNNYKMYILYRDSLYNEENTKKTVQAQMQYEFDKKQTADSLKVSEERKITNLKFEQEKKQRYYLYGGLLLVVLFAGFMLNRFIITQKQKKVIEQKEQETQQQKHIVEEKNKEITDSIIYAKRLQEAILPPHEFITGYLPDSFVLYKPKDIVAGDFYWAERVDNLFFIAAADSTGHGVPGAMVSVVCSNALDRTVKEFGVIETGKILDKTRELVIRTFEKSNADVKDGMDISLLCIDKKNQKAYWSGANNPLWYIQNNNLKEIKADKQSIGKSYDSKPFTTNIIDYKADTIFYLFTDGLADQFGGPKGKKFKYKQFEELLVSISEKPMQEQSVIINQKFEAWRGSHDQVDDVCVIGIRF